MKQIIGDSPAMQTVFRLVSQVADSDSTVLLLGETGTGKELIARAVHDHSPRRHKPMVKVNCAGLPAELIESELFGHERGSFTGATERRIGKFELANGGTLFLDEIGEMPLELQVKLLRVLQEREIERVGGHETLTLDVRIIAATNRDLEHEMLAGRFRADLYYRLHIFPIILPALRDRKEDIPFLAAHFVHRFARQTGKAIEGICPQAMQQLISYPWPGNIRELEHLIERSVLLASETWLKKIPLPTWRPPVSADTPFATMEEVERTYILKVLEHCDWQVCGSTGAAEILGMPTSTVFSRMKRLGITRDYEASFST